MFYRRRFRWRHPYPPPWWPQNEPWPPRPNIPLYDRPSFAPRRFRMAFGGMWMLFWIGMMLFWLAGARFHLPQQTESGGIVVMAILGVLAFVLVALVGVVANRVSAVMEAADRVAGGDYDVRVRETGPASVRALARSFNTMAERLQNHDRLRRDLMADVAHELRTPLTVIQGKLEGLIDGVYTPDAQQLQQLFEETRVLSRLVEDLRTVALSESGALKLQREATDISGLATDVVNGFAGEATTRGVTLTADAPHNLPSIDVDPVRIREVIANLVSNALRHTPQGGSVAVRVRMPDRGRAEVQVADTGSGMSPGDLARAFDRFYKGPNSRGSGLGLTIARNLVTAHGGEIRATSEAGRGTTITFTLPNVGRR